MVENATTNADAHVKVSMLLRIFEDQRIHSVKEIASLLNLSEDKAELLLRFLAEYRIITYDEERKTAVICDEFLALK